MGRSQKTEDIIASVDGRIDIIFSKRQGLSGCSFPFKTRFAASEPSGCPSHKISISYITMTSRQQQHQRKRKIVSFQQETSRHDPPLYESMPSIQDLWYTRLELSSIKKEVGRVLIEQIIQNRNSKAVDISYKPELWGLERHNIERAQAKKAAVKLILMAQHVKGVKGNPELLRSLSLQTTRPARDFAQDQGFRDACQHDTDAAEYVVDDCISDFVLPASSDYPSQRCKRPIVLSESYERRVRPRFSLA